MAILVSAVAAVVAASITGGTPAAAGPAAAPAHPAATGPAAARATAHLPAAVLADGGNRGW